MRSSYKPSRRHGPPFSISLPPLQNSTHVCSKLGILKNILPFTLSLKSILSFSRMSIMCSKLKVVWYVRVTDGPLVSILTES